MGIYIVLKAPILMLNMYCCYISATPPNPPSSKEEQVRFADSSKAKDITPLPAIHFPFAFKFSFYTLSVVEIYAILSSALFPHSKTAANQTYDLDLSKGFFVGILLMYSGAIVRATSYRHLGRYFTFELSLRPGHKLITDGPYSIVRHPSYVGSLFFYSGACLTQMVSPGSWFVESGMWTGNGGKLFALAYLGYSITICYFLLSRVPVEDRVLQKEFKEEWVDWSKRTPYRLIPFVY